jgi:ribonuclease-3
MLTQDRRLQVERQIGYMFRDRDLLITALTHKSFVNEHPDLGASDNERLEFLGDAVLDLIVSRFLLERFPGSSEGELSKLRATVVCEGALARLARRLGLGDCLRLGRGEELTGGRAKPSILANAYEAVLAAVFLDGGLEAATRVLSGELAETLDALQRGEGVVDHKTRLQELAQAELRVVPRYRLVSSTGPDHDKTFEVDLILADEVVARGTGKTKKEAEQRAAEVALRHLQERRGASSGRNGDVG